MYIASLECVESLLVTNAQIHSKKKKRMFTYAQVSKFHSPIPCKPVSAENSLYGECGLNFKLKIINRCRRFSGMPTILYCLPITDILPV